MTTGCDFYADALVERALGALEPGRDAWLDGHLARCAQCTATVRTLVALRAAPLAVPAGLEDRVRQAVRDAAGWGGSESPVGAPARSRPRVVRWRRWALPLAVAASLVAVWVGIGAPGTGTGTDDGVRSSVAVFEEYDPYGSWPADGPFVAGQPVLTELSIEELEHLLREMET